MRDEKYSVIEIDLLKFPEIVAIHTTYVVCRLRLEAW
jgi:hypothetical protein